MAEIHLSVMSAATLQADIKVEQDDSIHSVISGLALLGGAWTFVNGVFAAIFGSTLLLVLFGEHFCLFSGGRG